MGQNLPLGEFTSFSTLDATEQKLVASAWDGSFKAFCFQSNFPVGSAILAENARGSQRVFAGCNVENDSFAATICAERNAATTAVANGYTRFRAVCVVCRKIPGGSPCGLCRQVLNQFGRDAVLLNIVDTDKNVRRATVGALLPAARGLVYDRIEKLSDEEQALIKRALALKARSYVPYSKNPRGAVFVASNKKGLTRIFSGMACDNASYGGSIAAENVAMYAARIAGYTGDTILITTVKDVSMVNPIDGECLQVLREFGVDSEIFLVGDDGAVAHTSLTDLLPDSFGPESL